MIQPNSKLLRILHFNDVYDIQPKKKTNTAGAYYFKAYLDKYRDPLSLTLFSGDAFSPSVLSNIFQGNQMVHCLNQMHIDAACYGNHQFDYQIDHTINLASKCNFPWLLGNLIDERTNKPLGEAKESMVLEKGGLKIGLFGVAEEEWITLLTEDYQGQLEYIDFIKYSKYMVKELKNIYKCDLIIALTHMRVPNDQLLARQVPEIDFILGGHDHSIHNEIIGNTHIIKTGCNFNYLSVIDIYSKTQQTQYKGRNYNQTIQMIPINSVQDYDKQLKQYVDQKLKSYEQQNEKVMGYTMVPLETRFQIIRKKQTNYGNFVTDLIRSFYNIDAVTLQSGVIRSDCIFEPGPLIYSAISSVFDAFIVVKYLTGNMIHKLLEHSVSKYPAFEGRFMMVSGIRFTFDAALEPYKRIMKESITVNGSPLTEQKEYKVGMTEYASQGGDGYTFLSDCREYIEVENATKLTSLFMRFYKPRDLEQSTNSIQAIQEQKQQILKSLTLMKSKSSKSDRISKYINKIQQIDGKYIVFIEPKLDGRIKIINEV